MAHRLWRKVLRIVLAVVIAQLAYVVALRWVYPPVTLTQMGSWLGGHGLKRDYVSGKKISPHLKLAVIAAEDQLFAEHNGFDWAGIEQAMSDSRKKKKRLRGASTISQQTAKNVFLWQGRSWLRKGLEVYFTLLIELCWSKERILNVYLNVIETGPGAFGAEAAARHYYNKPAARLTRMEAARIAACLPNPKKYRAQPASPYVTRRANWILGQMNNLAGDEALAALLR
jgi:monofunctional biosynthetic peptidoglycan transglycosylase